MDWSKNLDFVSRAVRTFFAPVLLRCCCNRRLFTHSFVLAWALDSLRTTAENLLPVSPFLALISLFLSLFCFPLSQIPPSGTFAHHLSSWEIVLISESTAVLPLSSFAKIDFPAWQASTRNEPRKGCRMVCKLLWTCRSHQSHSSRRSNQLADERNN